jgi:hypothetical protein
VLDGAHSVVKKRHSPCSHRANTLRRIGWQNKWIHLSSHICVCIYLSIIFLSTYLPTYPLILPFFLYLHITYHLFIFIIVMSAMKGRMKINENNYWRFFFRWGHQEFWVLKNDIDFNNEVIVYFAGERSKSQIHMVWHTKQNCVLLFWQENIHWSWQKIRRWYFQDWLIKFDWYPSIRHRVFSK